MPLSPPLTAHYPRDMARAQSRSGTGILPVRHRLEACATCPLATRCPPLTGDPAGRPYRRACREAVPGHSLEEAGGSTGGAELLSGRAGDEER